MYLFVPGSSALAEEKTVIDRLEINIWPEYDQPGVLVIYRITLPASVSLPASLSVLIPSRAEKPFNVAMKDVDGDLYNLNYITEAQGQWIKVSWSTSTSEMQLEYYDPSLKDEDGRRAFDFLWLGEHTVESLVVKVQQPATAVDMLFTEKMGDGRQEQDGLIYYTAVYGRLGAGIPFRIHFSYVKRDETLSANTHAVEPVQPITMQTRGRMALMSSLQWVLAVTGILVICGGIFWYVFRLRAPALPGFEIFRTKRSSPAGQKAALPLYCSQCGKKALTGDRFCRGCGTKI